MLISFTMEGIISQRVTPIVKCMALFLLIFTAKVLTSRTQETLETKNNIQQVKPAHYVRTFTKYHHRRTNFQDVNNFVSPNMPEKPKSIAKRDVKSSSEFLQNTVKFPIMNQFSDEFDKSSKMIDNKKFYIKNDYVKKNRSNILKQLKVKMAEVFKKPAVAGLPPSPGISCYYKIQNVATSTYDEKSEEDNDNIRQKMVESDGNELPNQITETVLGNGEKVRIERCLEPQYTCYTLWHRDDDGNTTVLGQGCWRSAPERGETPCDKCTMVTTRLPGTRFCCCTKSLCNGDFLSLREEVVTPHAVLAPPTPPHNEDYTNMIAVCVLTFIAILVIGVTFNKIYCAKLTAVKNDLTEAGIINTGPEGLATGLLCVDNLTLIEHIGSGRYGSVWRGKLGTHSVAVKLYTNSSAWHKEVSIYALPYIPHPNILKYFGSDTRPTLTGGPGREHLIVLELCSTTLRGRLEETPLTWPEFANLAHGLASALAHLHSTSPTKPCIVHRDVNSNNVLLSIEGQPKLADLGLAQPLQRPYPTTIAEAGTLRYLAPEALEGALDLSGARAALCSVDVYALSLVLWEMLWRTRGAHPGPVPPYAPPYHHLGMPSRPTLAQMQSLVSRKKARPPLPQGPGSEAKALKICCDTCEECWDHDAEARLTAVCVEERMADLKQMLCSPSPVVYDNNLHPDLSDGGCQIVTVAEIDKNVKSAVEQNCDVATPLLYAQPHIGRNPCIERNTNSDIPTETQLLIHKSIKDVTIPIIEGPRVQNAEPCLSVARVTTFRPVLHENADRLNEIRSYQRPLDYVPNDVTAHDHNQSAKHSNILTEVKVEKPKWGIRKYFEKKLQRNAKPLETEVKLIPEIVANGGSDSSRFRTSVVNEKYCNGRPAPLDYDEDEILYNYEGPCLSPPNRTLSPAMLLESDMNKESNMFGFKEMPSKNGDEKPPNMIYAVIVPKAKPIDYTSNLIEMRSTDRSSSDSLNKTSVSSQSVFKSAGHSESEDSTLKKRLSGENQIISNAMSGCSSRVSVNLELQYMDSQTAKYPIQDSPFEIHSECSSSEDDHLMLLSENGGSRITMQSCVKATDIDKRKTNEVLKEASQAKPDFTFNTIQNKYKNFDNEYSDPHDKENVLNGLSGDNPVYLAAVNGELDAAGVSCEVEEKSPDKAVVERQHSLEEMNAIFSSWSEVALVKPAGRVKTPGDIPAAVRRARRDRALHKRRSDSNRLSLYDDTIMFGNTL